MVVVGGTKGIGAAVSSLARETNYNVHAFSRGGEFAEGLVPDASATSYSHDFASGLLPNPLKDRLALNEGLDVLVVTAGSGTAVKSGSLSEDFRVSALNNVAPFLNAVESFQDELRAARGSVVVVSSIAATGSVAAPPEYVASKSALNSYVSQLANQLAPVRVNAVAPGNVDSENSFWRRLGSEDPLKLRQILDDKTLLKRLGNPSEIAQVILFLASPEASFITGSIWTSDGGQLAKI